MFQRFCYKINSTAWYYVTPLHTGMTGNTKTARPSFCIAIRFRFSVRESPRTGARRTSGPVEDPTDTTRQKNLDVKFMHSRSHATKTTPISLLPWNSAFVTCHEHPHNNRISTPKQARRPLWLAILTVTQSLIILLFRWSTLYFVLCTVYWYKKDKI